MYFISTTNIDNLISMRNLLENNTTPLDAIPSNYNSGVNLTIINNATYIKESILININISNETESLYNNNIYIPKYHVLRIANILNSANAITVLDLQVGNNVIAYLSYNPNFNPSVENEEIIVPIKYFLTEYSLN